MSTQSIRITLREGEGVSIDIDNFQAAPALVGFGSCGSAGESMTAPAPKRFIDNNDGTVTDSKTGLMWSKDGAASERLTWKKADEACKALRLGDFDDWSLPSREQLLTLVDDTRHSPAIDTDAFPNCKSEFYWTGTAYAASPSGVAWLVNFGSGLSYYGYRGYSYRVRAVRVASRQ